MYYNWHMKNKLIALVLLLILLAVCGVLLAKRLTVSNSTLPKKPEITRSLIPNTDTNEASKQVETSKPQPSTESKSKVETEVNMDDLDKDIDTLNNSLDNLDL